ncbi:carboxylate-amine ligase [Petropleomorpha daqingensis]|uniref:Putative glutamate--cysteine ligase 2 n=1 Tax=Petropleomorpha daqingensis TaxID=2026353 RepID=A0A853CNK2_9ACTN|nr:carboxylate-amine ligase [Petropleomorpha daqingensis]
MTAVPRLVVGDLPVRDGDVPTVGVEEEFLLLRPDGRTALVAPDVLAGLRPEVRAQSEFARCQVETTTGVCTELGTVARELAAARRTLAAAAADRGAFLVASGTPPFDAPGLSELTDDPRYRLLVATVPGVTGEEITCAAHVHVAVPSRDLGVAVLGRLRPWLPVLLAMHGNSPLWRGQDTGWASHRFVVQRRWPSFVPPPRCADAGEYDRRIDDLVENRAALDGRGVYFWARLSPRYPTLEIRISDVCLTVEDAVLLTGLCRAAVMTAIADELAGRPVVDLPEPALLAAGSAAARSGPAALVPVPGRDAFAPAAEALDELLSAAAPALEASGDRELLGRLLAGSRSRPSGAERQRALWRLGDRPRLVRTLAALTAGGDPRR